MLSQRALERTTEALVGTSSSPTASDVFEVVDAGRHVSALRKPGQRVLFVVPLGELVTELQAKGARHHGRVRAVHERQPRGRRHVAGQNGKRADAGSPATGVPALRPEKRDPSC